MCLSERFHIIWPSYVRMIIIIGMPRAAMFGTTVIVRRDNALSYRYSCVHCGNWHVKLHAVYDDVTASAVPTSRDGIHASASNAGHDDIPASAVHVAHGDIPAPDTNIAHVTSPHPAQPCAVHSPIEVNAHAFPHKADSHLHIGSRSPACIPPRCIAQNSHSAICKLYMNSAKGYCKTVRSGL